MLLYQTLHIYNIDAIPIYVPSVGKVVDKNTREVYYSLPAKELSDFYRFNFEFIDYVYDDIYQPDKNIYNKIVSYRIYHLNIILKINNIISDNQSNILLVKKLQYYMSEIYQQRLYDKQKNNYDLESFISYRKTHLMYFIEKSMLKINDRYAYDLNLAKIVPSSQIKKHNFAFYGGIIETDQIDILAKHFDFENTLVLAPLIFSKNWQKAHVITYRDVVEKITLNFSKYQQLIIQESHHKLLPLIKQFAHDSKIDKIWIINSLPLNFYLRDNSINDICAISDIWLKYTLLQKKSQKRNLEHLFLTKFHQYYCKFYPKKSKIITNHVEIQWSEFEKNVYSLINVYYQNWLSKLSNDTNNKYSQTNKIKNTKLQRNIYLSTLNIISSATISTEEMLDAIVKNTLDNISPEAEKNDDIKKLVTRYQKYGKKEIYDEFDNKCCSICYDDFNDNDCIKTKLVCGHDYCLNCIIKALTQNNECPICKEYINCGKLAILRKENLLKSILENVSTDTLVLTDLNCISRFKNIINLIDLTCKKTIDIKKIYLSKRLLIIRLPDTLQKTENQDIIHQIISTFQILKFPIREIVLPNF